MKTETKDVRDVVAIMLNVTPEQINDGTRPDDIPKWDSLQHMIMVASVEEEFGVDIEPQEAVDMYKDFKTFRSIVERKLAGRNR